MKHDLLTEPLLSWRDRRLVRNATTLPGLLGHLAKGNVADFPAARAHQFHPWSMFLTQLAAIAIHRAHAVGVWTSESDWCRALLALTRDRHEPWTLVVEDLSAPAFFQPPVPEGSVATWKVEQCPDNVDVLVTTRNHDVKRSQIRSASPEMWVYALVTLQTSQGYPGRGYNRIARMKGGYGSRPRVGLTPDETPAARFSRDVTVLVEQWDSLLSRGFSEDGLALAWLEPWNGKTSIAAAALAPHFIEICWRIRLRERLWQIESTYTTTEVRRCAPETESGDVGDSWAPVARKDGGVLTVGASGLDFRLMWRLLCGADFEPAPTQNVRLTDPDPVLFNAAALARGQGKTEGLHDRTLVLSGPVRRRLGIPDGRAELGARAVAQLDVVTRVRSKVLFPAVKKLASGNTPAHQDFDAAVDDIFFQYLFEHVEQPANEASLAFTRVVRDLAWHDLQCAIDLTPLADSRRYSAIAAAEGTFEASMRKHFPDVYARAETSTEDVQ